MSSPRLGLAVSYSVAGMALIRDDAHWGPAMPSYAVQKPLLYMKLLLVNTATLHTCEDRKDVPESISYDTNTLAKPWQAGQHACMPIAYGQRRAGRA